MAHVGQVICSHMQGWRIRGFEGARAPPEHASAPAHYQKHPLKMKEKNSKTRFETDIQQVYGSFKVEPSLNQLQFVIPL